MTILITGSRGKTARPLTSLLSPNPDEDPEAPADADADADAAGAPPRRPPNPHPVLIASRNPSLDPNPRLPTVRLDWNDAGTYELPFAHPQARRSPIDRVYLVGDPARYRPSAGVLAFVRHARARGCRRFVLLSAWEVGEGHDALMGPAHAELRRLGEEEGVEWTVLRPQFFMENFAETYTLASIRKENRIYSAADEGRVAFVSARDIAAVAYRALIDEVPHNTDHIITGGEALTYDEIAAMFSEILSRSIQHKNLNQNQFETLLKKSGHMNKDMVQYMVGLDDDIACGKGGHVTDVVEKIVGRRPRTLRQFILDNKDLWSR